MSKLFVQVERVEDLIGRADDYFSGKDSVAAKRKPITNADNIRSMTDEELAELLTVVAQKSANKLCESLKTVDIDVDLSNCNFDILYKTHLNWLKQSAEICNKIEK